MEQLLSKIDKKRLPRHIAIIMDGNGRWAKQKGFIRAVGHENGTKAVRNTVEACAELGVDNLTLYAFSTENWRRPKLEGSNSNEVTNKVFKKEIKTLMDNNIRLCAIGNLSALPQKVYNELSEVIDKTKANSRMTLTLALSYGSREELLTALKSIVNEVNDKKISLEKIDESILNKHLYTHFSQMLIY